MKKLYIPVLLSLLFISTSVFASQIPTDPARFETSLSAPIGSTDTSMTLVSGLLNDGSSLTGYNCFTIDSNQPNVEDVCGMASGSSITSLTRGISGLTGTTSVAALKYSHRRGADVKITDFPTLTILSRVLNQIDTLLLPISYDSSVATTSFTGRQQIPDKGYVDDLAFNGAGVINATTNAKGVVQIATQLQTASSTGTGSSGATLVISSGNATSTYNAATAPLQVVTTQNNGRIDPNFVYPTTTVWPTTNQASSTVLSNNGSGSLSWEKQSDSVIGLNTILNLTSSNSATTTLATIKLPANVLNALSQSLRLTLYWWASNVGNPCYGGLDFGNGTSSTTQVAFISLNGNVPGLSTVSMIASTTSSEEFVTNNGVNNAVLPFNGFATTTLTAPTYIGINVSAKGGTPVCHLDGYSLEVLSSM